MQTARDNGVKVVLNGHGSDEVLAGYSDAVVPPFLAGLLLSGRLRRFRRERRALGQWNNSRQLMLECGWNLAPRALRPRLLQLVRRPQNQDAEVFVDGDRNRWSHSSVEKEIPRGMSPLDTVCGEVSTPAFFRAGCGWRIG